MLCMTDIASLSSVTTKCNTRLPQYTELIDVGPDGVVYGEDGVAITTIQPTTGEVTRIGKFPQSFEYGISGTLDRRTNQFYMWVYETDSSVELMQFDLNRRQFVHSKNVTSNGLYFGMQYQYA